MRRCPTCGNKTHAEAYAENKPNDGICFNYGVYINQRNHKKEIFARLGNKCVRCGFSDVRAIQIDHVLGKGRKHRGKAHKVTWRQFMAAPQLHQLLCANCNAIKKSENQELPSNVL